MVYRSLELIRRNLEDYINLQLKLLKEAEGSTGTPDTETVILQNIAFYETLKEEEDTDLSNIFISLVNTEEEASMKNNPMFRTKQLNGQVDYHNPPVFINLYLLFSACHTTYHKALHRLSLIMQFFQSRKIFTVPNAFDPNRSLGTSEKNPIFTVEEAAELQINMELFSMSFEQVNHLWGSLGGKQVPFVMYVARLVRIEDRTKRKGGSLVQELIINDI